MPGVNFWRLRHFYASLLIRHGESVKTVQSRPGYGNAEETLKTDVSACDLTLMIARGRLSTSSWVLRALRVLRLLLRGRFPSQPGNVGRVDL